MSNDIFYNHLTGFADIKVDTTTTPHRLLGRLAGGDYFEIGKDGEDGINQYLYIAYADDENGTNFNTTTPSTYISLLQSTEPIETLTADMFTTWSKFKGVDGVSSYVCVAYATSFMGDNITFTADESHPFVAFIVSDKPQDEVEESDFENAHFVRYHDAGWDNVSLEDLTDTNVSGKEIGSFLRYDGTEWSTQTLASVAYTGSYSDLVSTPITTTFDELYLSVTPNEDGSQTVAVDVDALQTLVQSEIRSDLGYNESVVESDANYFLNKNKQWIEVSGGSGGGLTSDMFDYPLVYDSSKVSLTMDDSYNDSSAVSMGWVKSNCYTSQDDVWSALGISYSGDAQSLLRQDGQWETISGIVGYVDKAHIDNMIGVFTDGSSTMFYNQVGEWVEVSGGGTSYTFSAPLSVDANNNVSIDTTGFITTVTKADVDAAIGATSEGSAVRFYNEQGNFVEVSGGGTSYTFSAPLSEVNGTVTFDDSGFVKSGDLDDYALRSEIPTVPTKTSELENDSGFITGITETMVETALGASESGSATKYLNEQGDFVEVGSSGGETTLSPAVITFTSSDLTDGVLNISYDRFVADSNTPVEVTLLDNNGVVRNADNTISIYWNETGLHIDFSACSVEGTWKLCYGVVTGKSADYIMTNNVSSTSTDTEVPTAKSVYEALSPIIADVGVAQSTAEQAQSVAETAQNTADSKITAPTTTGTAGQVLTLDSDAITPVWADPFGGGGGLTKAGEWKIFNANTVYTAETNGWIKVQVNDGMYCSVIIDGVELTAFYFDNEGAYALLPFYRSITPVFAGQTYKVTDCIAPMFAPCV